MRQKIDVRHCLDAAQRVRGSIAILLLTSASFVHAAPSGGEVTAGSGAISQTGNAVTIDQASSRLAINWQSFNIGSGESVTFNQPSSQAIALNRILGQDPSTILGSLSANGQVFLLNPNGVLFGAGAQVDVGGIVASTLSLSNDDFLAGRYTFAGEAAGAGIVNQGNITATQGGYVAFIAPSVVNEGVIRANGGTVALGAGSQVTLSLADNQLVGFNVDKAALGALAQNRQLIQADGGTVILSALAKDALLSSVVNNEGVIEARSVSSRNGVIRLEGGDSGVVSVAGTLDASGTGAGETGGQIVVTGDKVALLDGAQLDASGAAGGGSVRVGGGYQGDDADVRNAERTFVGSSAEIHADALEAGNGGQVVVWADGDTRFHGAISATGGAAGGNGGFVEVSGKQQLGFDGAVDTSAQNGAMGTLLLDPNDLYIAAAPVGGALPDTTNPFQSNNGVNDFYVLAGTLTALPVNTAIQLQANRDIIFQTSLAMPTTTGSLTFNALNTIQMNGFDLSTAGGAVSMTGANGILNLGAINLGAGALTLNSAGAITQNIGDSIGGSGALIKQGTGTLTLSNANTYAGVATVSAGTVSVTNAAGLGATTAGTTVASGATLSINNVALGAEALTINGAGVGGNGALIGSGTAASSGTVAMGSASTIGTAASGDTLSLLGVVSGGFALTKVGAGTLVSSAANTYTGATLINAGTLAVTTNNALGTTAGGTTIASGATLDLRNVTYSTAEALTVNGGTILASAGTSSLAGNIALGANSTVNVTGTQLTLSGVTSGATFGINKQSAGTLVLAGANTYTGATSVSGGTLRLNAANRIADTSAVTVASGATFDMNNFSDTVGSLAGAGNVTLGSGTLTAGGNGASTTYSGVASGTGGLTKTGAGVMTLSGANTYTGATTVSAGTLRASGGNAIADTSQVTLANTAGASLDLTSGETIGNLSGGGTTGGNVTLNANTLTVNQAGNTTYAGVMSGTGGLVKNGAGALTLSGANSYGGQTLINAGTLAAGANNVFGNSTNLVVNGGTLSLATRSDTVAGVQLLAGSITGTSGVLTSTSDYDLQSGTVTAALSGTVALNKSTGGTVLLSGANAYTGATNINAGTLRLGAAARIADTSATTVASGATFDLNNFAETVGSIAGSGTITLGSGTLTAGGNGSSTTYSGAISGTGGLTKAGAGVLTLNGANTYTGATTINGGTLRVSGGNAIADASQVALANTAGASLDLTSDEAIGNLTGGGATGGNITLNGNTLTVNAAAGTTYSGILSGSGGVTKQGVASLTLSGLNTYTGATTVTNGTLALGANNVLANGTQVVVNGGTLALTNRSDTVAGVQLQSGSITGTTGVLTSTTDFDLQSGTVTGVLGGAVALNKSTGGTVLLSGANTYTGATNINTGTLRLGAASRIADASAVTVASGALFDLNSFSETVGSVAGGGDITLGSATLTTGGNGASTTYSGAISGTGALTKTGAGVMTLSGANTYSGATTISAGTLRASGGNAIGDASQVTLANVANASLDLTNAEAIGNLGGGGTTGGRVTLNGNTLTVNESGATTYSGVMSGTGGLTKEGAGVLTLAGVNTFTGPVTISGGSVALSGGSALADAGAVALNGGSLLVSSAETIGSLSGALGTTLTLGAGLTFGDATNTTVASTIGGTGTLTKRGTGTVVLNGANTYSGATNINAGVLVASNSTALGTTAAGTTVANGAQLQIAGVNVGAEAVTLNGIGPTGNGSLTGLGTASLGGPITLASSSTIGVPNVGNSLTLNGTVNGAQALTQTGFGTLTFGGAVGNTTAPTSFSSSVGSITAINGGLVRTTGAQVYGGALVVGSPATLQTTNSSVTGAGPVNASSGALTFVAGSGAVTMLNPLNDFGSVGFTSAGAVNLVDSNGMSFANSNVGSLRAQTFAGDITLNGSIATTVSGDALVLVAANNFVNNAGPSALSAAGGGRWLVWSSNPANNVSGGLAYAFKQYNANYGLSPVSGSGNGFLYSVAPVITPTLVGTVTRAYNGNAVATLAPSNYASVGAIDGDVVTLNNPVNGTFDNRNVGTNKNVSATGISIANASNGGAIVYGYQLSSATVNGNVGSITPAGLTITATTNTKTYDGTVSAAATPTVTGLVGGDTVSSLSQVYADRNAGVGKTLSVATYAINDGNGGNNYTVALVNDLTGVIDPATLVGSITAANKIYDGNNVATINGRTLSGVISGDDVSYVGGTATFADRNAGAGKAVTGTGLSLVGADAANYVVNTTAATTATITPAALTIAATTNTKTYDGNVSAAATPTVTGLVGGDTATGVVQTYADRNAGTGKTLSVSGYTVNDGNGGANYEVTLVDDFTGVIDPAALVGAILASNKTYDGTVAATITSRTLTGVVAGDSVSYVGGTATFADRNAAPGKTVTGTGLSLAGSDAGNYTVNTTAATTASITPASLTIAATTNTKTYDGNVSAAGTPTVTGLVGGDTVTGLSQTYADRNVGTGKELSVASYTVNDGNGGANYMVALADDFTGVIDPASLVGSIMAANKTYDGTIAATITDRTLTGVVAGDSVTYVGGTAVFANKNAGTGKVVTATGLSLTGADAANYTVNTTATTTADIATLAITGAIAAAGKVYDGTDTATITNRTLTGAISGDDVTYVGGAATFADRNAGTGKTVTGSGLSLGGVDAGNYTVNTIATTLADITPASLTYVATHDRIAINTPFPTFGGSVVGFVGGDTQASATTGTAVFETTAADSSQVGIYAINGLGLLANFGNYTFTQDPANATALVITPRADPAPPEDGLEGLKGAIATALQTQGSCTGLQEAEGQEWCSQNALGAQPIEDAAFTREGAGIRLPAGVSVQ